MSAEPETGERTYHHGDLRAALLAAAREIVEEQGPEAFTLREAARLFAVTQGWLQTSMPHPPVC